jgi:hypothetical protein
MYNKPVLLPLNHSNNSILIKASIKIQTIISLSIMWAGGIAICSYLFFYADNAAQINYAPVIPITQIINNTNSTVPDNDAYVFVNVDKKHFLTRFVASVAAEDVVTGEKKIKTPHVITVTATTTTAVEKVFKKPQATTATNVNGFTIKPVPGT